MLVLVLNDVLQKDMLLDSGLPSLVEAKLALVVNSVSAVEWTFVGGSDADWRMC